jgi:hypothetical protein
MFFGPVAISSASLRISPSILSSSLAEQALQLLDLVLKEAIFGGRDDYF